MTIKASSQIEMAIEAANDHAEKYGRESGFVYLKSYLSMVVEDLKLQDESM